MSWAIVAVLAVIALWFGSRSRELFLLSVRNGRVLVVRGRVPPRFLGNARDIARDSAIRRGTLRAFARHDGAKVECSGDIDEGTAQRLRNVFQLHPMSALRNAPAIAKPTVGQLLGIAWLAWFLESRVRHGIREIR